MKSSYALFFFLFYCFGVCGERMSCSTALGRLKKGNERYVHDALNDLNQNPAGRESIVSKQSPFAIIVGCSDSRVSPEILFDQGMGDLFVVRVAGNVIGRLELESIDYASLYLESACVLVLGHENCGAVKAVINGTREHIESISKLIAPAVEEAKRSFPQNVLVAAIKENALRMKEYLLTTRVIKKLVQEKKIDVHAAYYDLSTGAVEWLD